MLIIDVAGHSVMEMPLNGTETPCMFQLAKDKFKLKYHALNMHWSVLIPPSILLGIGQLIYYCHYFYFGIHFSSEPSLYERSTSWHYLCYSRLFSTDWIDFHTSTLFLSSQHWTQMPILLWLVVDLLTYSLQAL